MFPRNLFNLYLDLEFSTSPSLKISQRNEKWVINQFLILQNPVKNLIYTNLLSIFRSILYFLQSSGNASKDYWRNVFPHFSSQIFPDYIYTKKNMGEYEKIQFTKTTYSRILLLTQLTLTYIYSKSVYYFFVQC